MRLISILLVPVLLSSTLAYGECNLKTDITRNDEGNFVYTPDCHRLVGKTFLDKRDLETQVIRYEDLLKISYEQTELERQRAELWRGTSYDLEKRVNNMAWVNDKNKLLYFGAGVILMLGASWAAGQAQR